MALRWNGDRVAALNKTEVPAHLIEAGTPWMRQLEALGFEWVGGFQFHAAEAGCLGAQALVLIHPQRPVRALVRPREEAQQAGQCWVSLRSTASDGREWVTHSVAVEIIFPGPEVIKGEVAATDSAEALLQAHQRRMDGASAEAWLRLDLGEAAAREQTLMDAQFAAIRDSGSVIVEPDGACVMRIPAALRRATIIVQQSRKAAQATKAAARSGTAVPPSLLSPEAQLEFDWQQYCQLGVLLRGKLSPRNKWLVSGVSLVLFVGALAWMYSPMVAGALLVALVIHECGHLAGMWWFGYRDTQLLFMPFFGGAAVGYDEKLLKPWQHIVVVLLGPLPGLFLGLALWSVGAAGGMPSWWNEVTGTFIILNAFNLLPILPLDGGQIFDQALGTRFPRLRVMFLAVSGVALVLLGIGLSGVTMLVVLGVFMLLRLPVEWRVVAVRRELRDEFPAGSEEEAVVRRLLRRLRAPEWAKTPMAHRLQLARSLQAGLRTPRASWGTLAFAVVAFSSPLWLGAPIALWGWARAGEARVAAAEARAREAGLAWAALPSASTLAAKDNAGALFAEAEALSAGNDEGVVTSREEWAAREAKAVTKLREAARLTAFLPVAEAGNGGRQGAFGHGSVLQSLVRDGQERLRFGESDAALSAAIDVLRLVRLTDQAPGWMHSSVRSIVVGQAWTLVEEAMAARGAPTSAQAEQLLELADERAEIRLAGEVAARELIWREDDNEAAVEGMGLPLRVLTAVAQLAYNPAEQRVELIDEAIALDVELRAVAGGSWPNLGASAEHYGAKWEVLGRLADAVARCRQVHAAVRWQRAEEGVGGVMSDWSGYRHPLTQEPVRLEKRGAREVLVFPAANAVLYGTEFSEDLIWRLPARQEAVDGVAR